MEIAMAVPLMAALVLGVAGPRATAAMRPSSAVRLVPIAAVATAAGSGFSLAVAALYLLGRSAPVAALGGWSVGALPDLDAVPPALGLPVAAVVAVLLAVSARHGIRVGQLLWSAESACRAMAPTLDDRCTVVVDDPSPDAFAVAGIRGRVIVSTAMLDALGRPQSEVLLAHERSHLWHRHHLWIQAVEIAAAANPLLRTLPAAVRLAAERWADEDAAAAVGDRRLTAQAIGRAALAQTASVRAGRARALTGLAATGADVTTRVRLLLQPVAHRWSRPVAVFVMGLVVAVLAAGAVTEHVTENRFEHARLAQVHATQGGEGELVAPVPHRAGPR